MIAVCGFKSSLVVEKFILGNETQIGCQQYLRTLLGRSLRSFVSRLTFLGLTWHFQKRPLLVVLFDIQSDKLFVVFLFSFPLFVELLQGGHLGRHNLLYRWLVILIEKNPVLILCDKCARIKKILLQMFVVF